MIMRILFWVPYPKEGPSNRLRVEQYLPHLEREGIYYTLMPFWRTAAYKILYRKGHYLKKLYFFILGFVSRILDILRIGNYDIVFIHRESCPLGGLFFEKILSRLRKPFIFDFDDAIFLSSSSKPNSFIEKFKNPSKIRGIIRLSSCVIAGNNYLAKFALKENNNVFILPTCIDSQVYRPCARKEAGNVVTIGWIGSITTSGFLEMMGNVFKQVSQRFGSKKVRFRIVGGECLGNQLDNLTCKEWSLEEEIEDLKTFDIGIMPMPDNPWTKGKCGFKAILYMSMAIPCVCSPVGVTTEIIKDGVNGLLAASEPDWIEKISLLIERPELRQGIGQQGRRTVEEKYSVSANAHNFLEIIRKAASKNAKE